MNKHEIMWGQWHNKAGVERTCQEVSLDIFLSICLDNILCSVDFKGTNKLSCGIHVIFFKNHKKFWQATFWKNSTDLKS